VLGARTTRLLPDSPSTPFPADREMNDSAKILVIQDVTKMMDS
jgi:hypothetical protein